MISSNNNAKWQFYSDVLSFQHDCNLFKGMLRQKKSSELEEINVGDDEQCDNCARRREVMTAFAPAPLFECACSSVTQSIRFGRGKGHGSSALDNQRAGGKMMHGP